MKKFYFLCFLLTACLNLFAQNAPIIITDDSIQNPQFPDRSLDPIPSATLIDGQIYLTYSESAPSIVSIIDVNTEDEVWYYEYGSTNQVIINLAAANITEGTFQIRIYIYGRWWWGEFVLNDEDD
ncbi:MAG: DUF3244 domain-containing protein [Bacteroidaceae bacterium]|nr:DUF3244 domain-containing protein [Bacteroidaceae bacterium]